VSLATPSYGIEWQTEQYRPIPEWWLDAQGAVDRDGDGPRLFAVSYAVRPRKELRVRYCHPTLPRAISEVTAAIETDRGIAPAGLNTVPRWPRSVCVDGRNAEDVTRPDEARHLRELWGERRDAIPDHGDALEGLR